MAGRITQDVVEVAVVPDSSNVRVTQDVVEVGVLPDTAVVRATQMVVEVAVIDPTYGGGGARSWGYILG